MFTPVLRTKDLLLLTRNLAVTLKAGVPLARALELFEEHERGHVRKAILHLRQSVQAGHSLADAMETSPIVFPSLCVNLIRTGELSGTLTGALFAVTSHFRKSQDLRRKLQTAMIYPLFILITSLGLGIVMCTFVLPQIVPLFESMKVELGWNTLLLIWIAKVIMKDGIAIAGVIMCLSAGILALIQLEPVKVVFHDVLLRIPLISRLQRSAALAEMCATLGVLLQSGIPLRQTILATSKASENRVFRRILLRSIPAIEAGNTFSQGLRRSKKHLPEFTLTLVDIGEQTGTLGDTLLYLSDFYDEEVDFSVKNLTASLEPAMLITVGLISAFVIFSIIGPIYGVIQSIG